MLGPSHERKVDHQLQEMARKLGGTAAVERVAEGLRATTIIFKPSNGRVRLADVLMGLTNGDDYSIPAIQRVVQAAGIIILKGLSINPHAELSGDPDFLTHSSGFNRQPLHTDMFVRGANPKYASEEIGPLPVACLASPSKEFAEGYDCPRVANTRFVAKDVFNQHIWEQVGAGQPFPSEMSPDHLCRLLEKHLRSMNDTNIERCFDVTTPERLAFDVQWEFGMAVLFNNPGLVHGRLAPEYKQGECPYEAKLLDCKYIFDAGSQYPTAYWDCFIRFINKCSLVYN